MSPEADKQLIWLVPATSMFLILFSIFPMQLIGRSPTPKQTFYASMVTLALLAIGGLTAFIGFQLYGHAN